MGEPGYTLVAGFQRVRLASGRLGTTTKLTLAPHWFAAHKTWQPAKQVGRVDRPKQPATLECNITRTREPQARSFSSKRIEQGSDVRLIDSPGVAWHRASEAGTDLCRLTFPFSWPAASCLHEAE